MVKTFQVYLGVNDSGCEGGSAGSSAASCGSSSGAESPEASSEDNSSSACLLNSPSSPMATSSFRGEEGGRLRTYSCVHCRAHLARHQDLISKSFQGSQGRAYLFDHVVNVSCGKTEDRLLLTGECSLLPVCWAFIRLIQDLNRMR